MRASSPTDCLHCLLPIIKKLCRERLIPAQEPNQRSGWPLKSGCGRSDLPYIFRITLPAKNLSPFYPIRPEKYVDKPRFIWYIIQAIFCGHGPLVKRLRQRPLTPLTWVRFPHGSLAEVPKSDDYSFDFGAFFVCIAHTTLLPNSRNSVEREAPIEKEISPCPDDGQGEIVRYGIVWSRRKSRTRRICRRT